MLRLPELNLGELEHAVLETLWSSGPLNPIEVHEQLGAPRRPSLNTVSSALKRLYEKGLLERRKVSHAYVYEAVVTRSELQRKLIGAIVAQFEGSGGSGVLAAFVDVAQSHGEETLRRLEKMIADRLAGGDR